MDVFAGGTEMTRDMAQIQSGIITPNFLEEMWEKWPDHETARFLTNRLHVIEKTTKQHYIEIGLIVDAVDTNELYKHVTDSKTGKPYTSLHRWVLGEAPYSKSTAYAARDAVRVLKNIPTSDLLEMPRDNINTLTYSTSSNVREKPDVIEAAKQKPEEFKAYLNESYDQAVEVKQKTTFYLTKSATKIIEDVLAYVMRQEGMTREEAVESVFVGYANDNNLWKELES